MKITISAQGAFVVAAEVVAFAERPAGELGEAVLRGAGSRAARVSDISTARSRSSSKRARSR
jgi:hypothetical protein